MYVFIVFMYTFEFLIFLLSFYKVTLSPQFDHNAFKGHYSCSWSSSSHRCPKEQLMRGHILNFICIDRSPAWRQHSIPRKVSCPLIIVSDAGSVSPSSLTAPPAVSRTGSPLKRTPRAASCTTCAMTTGA